MRFILGVSLLMRFFAGPVPPPVDSGSFLRLRVLPLPPANLRVFFVGFVAMIDPCS